MEELNQLSKKERREIRRQEKEEVRGALKKSKGLFRTLLCLGVVVILGGAIWGLVKLNKAGPALSLTNEVVASDWVKGNRESKVILIEYGDFQCPACKSYFPIVKQLAQEYGDRMQFVYRHYPLPQHYNAKPSAYAAEAAGKQGKFWEMHDKIYENQDAWAAGSGKEIFENYASQLGLNMDQYKADRDSEAVKEKVNLDYKSGVQAGIRGTPTFFLNGTQIQPGNLTEFKSLIEDAITKNP